MFLGCSPCCGNPCLGLSPGVGHKFASNFTGDAIPSVGDSYSPVGGLKREGEFTATSWTFRDIDLYDGTVEIVADSSQYAGYTVSSLAPPRVVATYYGTKHLAGFSWSSPTDYECNRLQRCYMNGGGISHYVFTPDSDGIRRNFATATYELGFYYDGTGIIPTAGIQGPTITYYVTGSNGLPQSVKLRSSITLDSTVFFGTAFPTPLVFVVPEHETIGSRRASKAGYTTVIVPLDQWGGSLATTATIRVPINCQALLNPGTVYYPSLSAGWTLTDCGSGNAFGWATYPVELTYTWPEGLDVYSQ